MKEREKKKERRKKKEKELIRLKNREAKISKLRVTGVTSHPAESDRLRRRRGGGVCRRRI